jgi:hypothetical protein
MSGQSLAVTKDEVAAFSAKLEQWGATLAPKERALLDVLVKLAGKGLPQGSELPDSQLEGVSGGTGPQNLGLQTSRLFGQLTGGPFMGPASAMGGGIIVVPK